MSVFFRDTVLSDAIGFRCQDYEDDGQAARDFLGHVKERFAGRIAGDGDRVLAVVLDGENAWGAYREDGRPFLRALYAALTRGREVQTVTFAEYLDGNPGRGVRPHPMERQARVYNLFTGSWIDELGSAPGVDLGTWIGEAEENRGWELLGRARDALDRRGASPDAAPGAFEALYFAEGSDWFWWFGEDQDSGRDEEFDDLFRTHLKNVYRGLGAQPPAELDRTIVPRTVLWTFTAPVARLGPRDRLTVRTNCPGVLTWWADDEPAREQALAPVGGVLAGAQRHAVVLGPFSIGTREVRLSFRCLHPGCDGQGRVVRPPHRLCGSLRPTSSPRRRPRPGRLELTPGRRRWRSSGRRRGGGRCLRAGLRLRPVIRRGSPQGTFSPASALPQAGRVPMTQEALSTRRLTMAISVGTPLRASPRGRDPTRVAAGGQGTQPSGLWPWLDDRLGLSALRYAVPAHANTFWYTLGGITFFGLIVLVATGIWLAQYYNPDPAAARESVLYIQNVAPLGDVVRGVHVWTAYLVVITAALHMVRVFVTASYKVPRELNWLVGLALLALVMFGGVFTGTILRWDQEAYEAMAHNMEATELLGAIGGFFSHGFTTSVAMLPRLYAAHVSIVPTLLILFLIAHVFLIKHHGLSPSPAQADAGEAPGGRLPKEKQTGHYPTHLRLMVGYGLALLGLAGMLGLVFPQPIGPTPDPTMEVTKPPFLFFWLYSFEDLLGGVRGILYAAIAFFGLLVVVPFVDRSPFRALRRRPVMAALGVALLVAVVALSFWVGLAPPASHLGD